MKIGILTYHRSHNFGALLQAFALKTYLNSLGYDGQIIDYFPDFHKETYRLWSWRLFWHKNLISKIKSGLKIIFSFAGKRQKSKKINRFIDKYLAPTPIPTADEPFDTVIYGSDQIWRYQDNMIFTGFDDIYFGSEQIPAKKRITYSASMGIIVNNAETRQYLQTALKRFSAVAVREQNLLNFIQPLTTKNVYLTADPVFLLPREEWETMVRPAHTVEKYILVYDLLSSPVVGQIAKILSKNKNLPVVRIRSSVNIIENRYNKSIIDPIEFLSLIKHAEYVVTSSFHGVAFSIIFKKEFYVNLPKNRGRVENLLARLGVSERMINSISELNEKTKLNYQTINDAVQLYRRDSQEYLQKALNEN